MIEALVPVLKVVADVLVFVHGLRSCRANKDVKQESQNGNKEFKNPGRRGLQRTAETCSA